MPIGLNIKEFLFDSFIISMKWCDESCNTIEDQFSRIYVPNKVEGVNLKVFYVIKRINELKALAKHISCECRCEFNCRKSHSRQI